MKQKIQFLIVSMLFLLATPAALTAYGQPVLTFAAQNGTITAKAGGATITSGATVAQGTTLTFTITPSQGYTLSSLTTQQFIFGEDFQVNNRSVGIDTGTDVTASATYSASTGTYTYTCTMPANNFDVRAVFTLKPITFADDNVKTLCVANWDTNHDGELSFNEAAAVTDLGTVFKGNTEITSFDELQYFTGLTEIGDNSFDFCTALTSVIIPSTVTTIGVDAFSHCPMTTVTIPESVEIIRNWAFSDCGVLTSVTIPESVTSLGQGAFSCCYGLTSVNIPNSITSISEHAFAHCSALTSVEIPNTVTSIGDRAFHGCSSLTELAIPSSVSSIGWGAFEQTPQLASIIVDDANAIFDSRDNCNAIIETATNTLVAGCKNTVIPNTITAIGGAAFTGCTGLTSMTIPNSVTSIGDYAFNECSGLTSVTIPESVTSIGNEAFSACSGLTEIHWTPNADTDLSSSLSSANLTSTSRTLYLHNTADNAAMVDHLVSSLTGKFKEIIVNINFADDNVKALCVANWDTNHDGELSYNEAAAVTSLGEVFKGNTEITSFDELQYFTGLTAIADQAFNGCENLTSVAIPENVTSIGNCAFANSYMTSVIIPNSVTSIAGNPFRNCENLVSIIVEDGNPVYDSRGNCNAIIETSTNVLIAGSQNTMIPNSVVAIGDAAFDHYWKQKSVIIPNSITSIGVEAFWWCQTLEQVISQIETPFEFGERAFDYISAYCVLYVPAGTKDAYIAAGWTEEIFKGGNYESTPDKRAIDAMYELMASTNVYTQEAYDTYKALADGYMAQYEAGTLTEQVVNPYLTNGYKYVNTYDDFLLSAWTIGGEQCVHYNKALYINAWSTEGIYDGSEMKVPFYEYYIDDDNSLANNTLSATVEGITPGVYEVELLARVRLRDDRNETPTGITMSVNGGDADDLCAGTQSENPDFSQMYYGTFKATGVVGTDGILTININVDNTNCSWLAFKNVKYSKVEDVVPDTDISQIDNVVYIESTEVSAGSEETLSIKMKNTDGIQTLQFDLYLPDGVEVLTDEDDFELIELSTERTTARKMDQFSVQRMSNGAYRVLINSSRGYTFDGTDGEIATVQVGISETMTPGNYPVIFRNIVLVNTSSVGYETDYVKCSLNIPDYKPGDVNNDTKVNAIDLNAITNYILERRDFPFTFNKKAANINGDKETNGDEKINAIDLNAVTNMILNQGATTSGVNRRVDILIPD